MRVGPYISVGIQTEKAEVGPTSGPTWRLSYLVVSDQEFVPIAGRTVGADATIVLQQQQQGEEGDADREDEDPEQADRVSKSLVAVLVAADLVVDIEIRLRLTELAA